MDSPHWAATLLKGFTARHDLINYLDYVLSKCATNYQTTCIPNTSSFCIDKEGNEHFIGTFDKSILSLVLLDQTDMVSLENF